MKLANAKGVHQLEPHRLCPQALEEFVTSLFTVTSKVILLLFTTTCGLEIE